MAMTKNLLASLTAASLVSIVTPQLGAQGYPNRAINLVIPTAPGDAGDVAGRLMGEELAKLLKVPVVPVNKPGAAATIGTDSVAKAKKDGYTIVVTPSAALISARILNPETVPYDPFKDLTPLGLPVRSPVILVVRSDAPHKTFAEMVEFSKKNPGKLRAGTFGAGSIGHFNLEIINSVTGAGVTMVPFKGMAPAVTALLGGHVEAIVPALGAVSSHLRSGAMRGLVISNKFPEFAEVPTLTHLGYRQNLVALWLAFFAPAGVAADVTAALVPAIEKVAKSAAVGERLAAIGMVQEYASPEKLVADMREEHKLMEEIAKKAGLVK
jgi:tripartite-type tricarboxylate transporter receptor subunit TctC